MTSSDCCSDSTLPRKGNLCSLPCSYFAYITLTKTEVQTSQQIRIASGGDSL